MAYVCTFWQKEIGAKAARKMVVKLTAGLTVWLLLVITLTMLGLLSRQRTISSWKEIRLDFDSFHFGNLQNNKSFEASTIKVTKQLILHFGLLKNFFISKTLILQYCKNLKSGYVYSQIKQNCCNVKPVQFCQFS